MYYSLRRTIKKWLYGSCPGFAGSFPYFGTRVYFPKGCVLFEIACDQGVFESNNVHFLQKLVRPGSTFFDVGTNIGLMSAPVLQAVPDARIVSFEPSPNTLPWLRRTIDESPHRDRWTLIPKAVGKGIGQVAFSLSKREQGPFDGIKNTRRVEEAGQATVDLTTLDHEWEQLGRPDVSVIKIDVEGGELAALQGAIALMARCRPLLLVEWNETNLKPYDVAPTALYDFARTQDYVLLAMPHFVPVTAAEALPLHLLSTESFVLAPAHESNENR